MIQNAMTKRPKRSNLVDWINAMVELDILRACNDSASGVVKVI